MIFKEILVDQSDRLLADAAVHDQAQVDERGALGDHVDAVGPEGLGQGGEKSRLRVEVLADDGDLRLVAVHGDVGEFGEFRHDGGEIGASVDGHGKYWPRMC